MRDQYNNLIKEKGISNILFYLTDLPYSQKLSILNKLLDKYSVELLNVSLEEFYMRYILLNRIDNNRILNTLKGICNRLNK
jgi:hypothetical protein